MTRARMIPGALALASLAAVLIGCAGTGGVEGPAGARRPDWLVAYPADPNYYVGIGGSQTGNLGDDRSSAASRARADLAANIAVTVTSELQATAHASSDGSFRESVDQDVSERVEQNLRAVETVATWNSPDEGYWVYVRLSKQAWQSIIRAEVDDLTERAEGILVPGQDLANTLAALGRARKVLAESPWGIRVTSPVLGGEGVLLDRIDSEASRLTAAMSVSASIAPDVVKSGREVRLSGSVRSADGLPTGAFPLAVALPSGGTVPVVTDRNGDFAAAIDPEAPEPGIHRLTVSADMEALGLASLGLPLPAVSPEFTVEAYRASLAVESGGDAALAVLDGSVRDWLSRLPAPIALTAPSDAELTIRFAWTVSDFPRSDRLPNAPYMTQVGAVVELGDGRDVVWTRRIEAVKDGGLDWNQAHERAARGLLESLAGDGAFASELTEAILGL